MSKNQEEMNMKKKSEMCPLKRRSSKKIKIDKNTESKSEPVENPDQIQSMNKKMDMLLSNMQSLEEYKRNQQNQSSENNLTFFNHMFYTYLDSFNNNSATSNILQCGMHLFAYLCKTGCFDESLKKELSLD